MPWVSGTFSRLYSWVTDDAGNIPITASRMDADTNDIVTGMNQIVSGVILLNVPPRPAPAAPSIGWVLYSDSGDGNKLKAKAYTGIVVTLGTP
jgi:hypothetical protein